MDLSVFHKQEEIRSCQLYPWKDTSFVCLSASAMPDSWENWKQVTSNEQFIRSYCSVMNRDSSISAALSLADITENNDTLFGKSSLIVSGLEEISDLSFRIITWCRH